MIESWRVEHEWCKGNAKERRVKVGSFFTRLFPDEGGGGTTYLFTSYFFSFDFKMINSSISLLPFHDLALHMGEGEGGQNHL